jgi:hypothetical protein
MRRFDSCRRLKPVPLWSKEGFPGKMLGDGGSSPPRGFLVFFYLVVAFPRRGCKATALRFGGRPHGFESGEF